MSDHKIEVRVSGENLPANPVKLDVEVNGLGFGLGGFFIMIGLVCAAQIIVEKL